MTVRSSDSSRPDPLAGVPRQGLLNLAATLVPGVYAVVLVSILLRSLGPEGYAPWAAAMALVGWLALLDVGLASTTVREAARALAGEAEAAARVATSHAMYVALGASATAIGSVAALAIPWLLRLEGGAAREAWLTGAILAADLGVVLGTSAWMGVLRGARRFDAVLGVNVVQVATALATTIVLFPVLGLVGAALGQLAGRIGSRAVAALFLRGMAPWFVLTPTRPRWTLLRVVGGFSLPIFAMQLATQIGIGTDVVIVGLIGGPLAVGLYAAGSQLVRYLSQFLFPVLSVLLPAFSVVALAGRTTARAPFLRALLLASILGAGAFGGLAVEAEAIMQLWSGQADPLSTAVLRLYAAAFIAVTPAHLMILMLIAQGRHGIIGVLVLVEATANLVLSVALGTLIGPVGVAISSFMMILLDDLIAIPLVASRRLTIPLRALYGRIAVGISLGLLVAGVAHAVPVGGLVVHVAVGGLLGLAIVAVVWRVTAPSRTADVRAAAETERP